MTDKKTLKKRFSSEKESLHAFACGCGIPVCACSTPTSADYNGSATNMYQEAIAAQQKV